jgi:site-specific DNA-methyltransferase (cytosine-N4-specific)
MVGRVVAGTRAEHIPLEDGVVQTTVTSPPYWGQRDYGFDGQSGIEEMFTDYLDWWVEVATEIRRVTSESGTLWLVVGDTYNTRTAIRPSAHQAGLGHDTSSTRMSFAQHRDLGLARYSSRQPGLKDKDLMGLPWRMAMIAQEAGWWLRCDVIWSKQWPTPENAADRPARSHEYVFLLSKTQRKVKARRTPFIDQHRSVWPIPQRRGQSGPAAFPDQLVERCLEATSDPGDLVLDPFGGSGTVLRVAERMGRSASSFDAAPAELLDDWWRQADLWDSSPTDLEVVREENTELKLEIQFLKSEWRDLEMHVSECERTGG